MFSYIAYEFCFSGKYKSRRWRRGKGYELEGVCKVVDLGKVQGDISQNDSAM